MMISEVYRTLWRSKLFVLFVMCVVVAAAYFFTSRQTKLYTAASLVRVQQTVQNEAEVFGALMTGERLARTYATIAQTSAVREIVRDDLPGNRSVDTAMIDATQLSNLELLWIEVTDPDPKGASEIANALPVALAKFIKRTGTFQDTITVVQQAGQPSVPSSPNLKLNLILAAIFGLILAGALALLKESVSDRIRSIEELEAVTRQPVIATIPNLKFAPLPREGRGRGRQRSVVGFDPAASGEVGALVAADGGSRAARWSVRA